MRRWSVRHDAWQKAVDAIRLTQQMNQEGETNVAITARTVIAQPNLHDIANIPNALSENGVKLSDIRMKMYQVEPFGPHFSHIDFNEDWAVTAQEAQMAASQARANSPDANITLQLYGGTVGRYFLVDPDGYATGTDEDTFHNPLEISYGNIVHDFDTTLDAYRQHKARLDIAA
jgi:hypothetical protein